MILGTRLTEIPFTTQAVARALHGGNGTNGGH